MFLHSLGEPILSSGSFFILLVTQLLHLDTYKFLLVTQFFHLEASLGSFRLIFLLATLIYLLASVFLEFRILVTPNTLYFLSDPLVFHLHSIVLHKNEFLCRLEDLH